MGLPIHQDGNTVFKGDKVFKDEMTDRDPRLAANIDLEGVRLNGICRCGIWYWRLFWYSFC